MNLNVILLLLVGICIVLADKMDEATKSDGKMKKVIYVCGAGVLLIDLIAWFASRLA